MQGCSSIECEKKNECARFYTNLKEVAPVENWATFGSGFIGSSGVEESWACGRNGNYAMFIPIEKEKKPVKVVVGGKEVFEIDLSEPIPEVIEIKEDTPWGDKWAFFALAHLLGGSVKFNEENLKEIKEKYSKDKIDED